jgi:Outer membrane protein beta-barrel domain
MFRHLFLLILLTTTFQFSIAQEKVQKARRPDLPGSFIVEFGFNRALGSTPSRFEQGFWGSRTLNLYYQYPIRLLKSKFSYNPAFGLSFERYKLTNNYSLTRIPEADGTYALRPASDLGMPNADKSMLIMNYIDFMPAELRFDTNPDDKNRSFHVSAGVRVGFLFESHTKVNYRDGGEDITLKSKQNFGLSSFRYGFYGKLGVGSFDFFGYYNATPVFKENKGPEQTAMNTLTFGISLSGF